MMNSLCSRSLFLAALLAASTVGADRARADEPPPTDDAPPAGDSPSADDATAASSWFRIDTDWYGTQFWVGANHPVGGLEIASNIYLVDTFAELDVGLSFTIGSVNVTPMAGLGFDFAGEGLVAIIAPQLYLILDHGPWYGESWNQLALYSVFEDEAEDELYTRNFLLFEVLSGLYLGPQVEAAFRVGGGVADAPRELVSLPFGGRVNVAYGSGNTLGIFVGYDTEAAEDSSALTGRFTFVREF